MGFLRKLRNLSVKNRSAREWYDLGRQIAAEGDLQETHDALKRALASNPETGDLCIQIGLALDGLNDIEGAAEAFRRATHLDPRSMQAHLQLGGLMMKHGRPDHALKPLREALKLADYSADACVRYATALERMNELEEAMCYFHLAGEAAPNDVDVLRHLGRILLRVGHFAGAIRAWRTVLTLTPNDLTAMTQLGISLSQWGQHDPAIKLLTQVARARPDSPEAYSDLGLTLSRSGSHEAAIHSLKQAIQLKPRSPQLHLNLGVALMAAGRLEEAVATYWDVVSLAPDWSVAHFNVGMALKELGDIEGAKNALAKAQSIAPEDPDILAALKELSTSENRAPARKLPTSSELKAPEVPRRSSPDAGPFVDKRPSGELGKNPTGEHRVREGMAPRKTPDPSRISGPDVASSATPREGTRSRESLRPDGSSRHDAPARTSDLPRESRSETSRSDPARSESAVMRSDVNAGRAESSIPTRMERASDPLRTADLRPGPGNVTGDLARQAQEAALRASNETTKKVLESSLAPPEDTRRVPMPEAARHESARMESARQELARTLSDTPGPGPTSMSSPPVPRSAESRARQHQQAQQQKSITGEIELFPIAEVLEFLKVHRSTGVLRVTSEHGQGELRMRDGNLTGGSSPSTKDLITLLVSLGHISQGDVHGKHLAEPPERVGASMVEDGVISTDTLRKASMMQIESALTELVSWKKGDFTFRAERVSEKESEISVDTRGALMDVLRKLDESKWAASKGQ